MPITRDGRSLFSHVRFVRNGLDFTVPSAGTVSKTAIPGQGDPLWLDFTGVEEFKTEITGEETKRKGGAPGGLVTLQVIELSKELKVTFTCTEIHPVALQLMFGTVGLSESANQASPLFGGRITKGWLHFQAYDEAMGLQVTGDLFVAMKVTGSEPWSGMNNFKVTFEAEVEFTNLQRLKFGDS